MKKRIEQKYEDVPVKAEITECIKKYINTPFNNLHFDDVADFVEYATTLMIIEVNAWKIAEGDQYNQSAFFS